MGGGPLGFAWKCDREMKSWKYRYFTAVPGDNDDVEIAYYKTERCQAKCNSFIFSGKTIRLGYAEILYPGKGVWKKTGGHESGEGRGLQITGNETKTGAERTFHLSFENYGLFADFLEKMGNFGLREQFDPNDRRRALLSAHGPQVVDKLPAANVERDRVISSRRDERDALGFGFLVELDELGLVRGLASDVDVVRSLLHAATGERKPVLQVRTRIRQHNLRLPAHPRQEGLVVRVPDKPANLFELGEIALLRYPGRHLLQLGGVPASKSEPVGGDSVRLELAGEMLGRELAGEARCTKDDHVVLPRHRRHRHCVWPH